jgi:acetoin utilization protein AcuB
MKVRDIMTWNVITVSSDTAIMDARKIMETHKVRRLPVVDRGKLVGIVTFDRIVGVGPSSASTLSVWEINYILSKMTIKEVMQKDVVTIDPEASVEQGLAIGFNNKVGIIPVVENGKVVGVVTTTDFMIRILYPILGIGRPGTRLNIAEANKPKNIKEIMEITEKGGFKVISAAILPPNDAAPNGFMLHLDTDDTAKLVKDIEAKGYKVIVVNR